MQSLRDVRFTIGVTCLCYGPVMLLLAGCQQRDDDAMAPESLPSKTVHFANIKPQVAEFCGDCHATPQPDTFPKEAWQKEVERGFAFYVDSGRRDLAVPSLDEVVGFYENLAPERLATNPPRNYDQAIRFHRGSTDSPELEPPAVSFVDWMSIPGLGQQRHLFCDMRSGLVGIATVAPQGSSLEKLTTLRNPSRVALCDLDGDGRDEFIVCELGSFTSGDHRRGALVWLRWDQAQKTWRQRLLVSGLGRVADVRSGDFDGDGDFDLMVAEFGHLRTGRVLMYENLKIERGGPVLREHVVDKRHGAIHVPVADLNGDGRLDFVALISQEHEVIEAYLNSGEGSFERKTIFAAGDPAYGSSGIELVDLDRDGDLDVLYINGDAFGSDYFKPYHGITWLENQGGFPFIEHRLTQMVGVHRAVAADLDGDNDLDVVASGFLPQNLAATPELANHDSLIWLEQTEPGRFVRHSLEKAKFLHAALAVADFDQDGDNDLAVGNFQNSERPHEPWLTIWWNVSR